jgi:hypothetical protein
MRNFGECIEPIAKRRRAQREEKWRESGRDCHPRPRSVDPGITDGMMMIMFDSNRS